jgi:predicted deacylase
MQTQTEKILRLELPYRDTLDIQRTVFQGGPGPKAAVISGIHGDEIEGLYVCHQLAVWLAEHPQYLFGRVELYPAANPHGLTNIERFVPVFESDLNRNFPGHADGLVPQRMADAIFRSTRGASVVIDIHASNIFLREIPQVRISQAFSDHLIPLARQMNLDLIWVHGSMTVMEATVSHSLNSVGTPCLVVEMGVGMRVTPVFTSQIVTGILHVWRSLGVLSPETPLEDLTHEPALATDSNVHYLNAETSGLFIPCMEHWQSVKKGDRLGSIVSPFHGNPLSEVWSPVDGILFTLREYPLVYEGSLIARIMATGENGERL